MKKIGIASLVFGLALMLGIGSIAYAQSAVQAEPLRVSTINPRYFSDSEGKIVYLAGSHTWLNFQDSGTADPPAAFNYTAYLNFMETYGHNFMRLWMFDFPKWIYYAVGKTYYFSPMPWQRSGPGNAADGKLKFDLTLFNQSYFDRLRSRVIAAGQKGIYTSVMLFQGQHDGGGAYDWWANHPFNNNNNINGIDGDPGSTGNGIKLQSLDIPAITAIQEAYVRKVIDTVNDLDNVLYEICNEPDSASEQWQYHMINFIKTYEAGKPKQHPVGMTVEYPPDSQTGRSNTELFASPADWISPNEDGGYKDNPPAANGNKVVLPDTDHLWGIGGDRVWAWKSFTRGMNPVFMDQYSNTFVGLGVPNFNTNDPVWIRLRQNLGYTRTYANKMNLLLMTPQNALSSTGYVLANPGTEYLVYQPSSGVFTVNLVAKSYSYEWFNPATGAIAETGTFIATGGSRSFTPPFSGDSVLYLIRTLSSDATPPSIPTGLTMNAVSQTYAYFSWTGSTDDTSVAGYKVFRNGVKIGDVAVTSYHDINLTPATTYIYNVLAYDTAGNASGQSQPLSITTLPVDNTMPIISSIILSNIRGTSARIIWTTDQLSDSRVEYGKTTSYGKTVSNTTLVTSHGITLTGLTPGTLYHFRVRSNSAVSSDKTFRTSWWYW